MKKESYYEDSDTESVKSDTSNITTSSIHSGTSMASSQVKQKYFNWIFTYFACFRHRVKSRAPLILVASRKHRPLLRVASRQGQLMIINEDERMMSRTNQIHQSLHTLLAARMLVEIGKLLVRTFYRWSHGNISKIYNPNVSAKIHL